MPFDPAMTLAGAPRLAPITHVRSLRVRLFAALFRSQLGKVMTPVWVIYARMPGLVWPQMMMARLAQAGLSLDPTLVDLVQIRVSRTYGCAFCTDLHCAIAQRSGRDASKLVAVAQPDLEAPFSDAERAALRFADEMATGTGVPSDATFAAVHAAFAGQHPAPDLQTTPRLPPNEAGERAIVELVWLCSFTLYLNRMARALRIGSDGFCPIGS
jgi:AhpD family alkylhydroperoxidase